MTRRGGQVRVPLTIQLTIVSLILGIAIGVALGVYAAIHRNRVIDYAVRVSSLLGVSPVQSKALLLNGPLQRCSRLLGHTTLSARECGQATEDGDCRK